MAEPEEQFTKAKDGSRINILIPDIQNSRIPSVKKFLRLIQRFKDTGSREKGKTSGCKAERMTEENIETIHQMIEDKNILDINGIACEV